MFEVVTASIWLVLSLAMALDGNIRINSPGRDLNGEQFGFLGVPGLILGGLNFASACWIIMGTLGGPPSEAGVVTTMKILGVVVATSSVLFGMCILWRIRRRLQDGRLRYPDRLQGMIAVLTGAAGAVTLVLGS